MAVWRGYFEPFGPPLEELLDWYSAPPSAGCLPCLNSAEVSSLHLEEADSVGLDRKTMESKLQRGIEDRY